MTIQEALQNAARSLQPPKLSCTADQNLGRLEAEILLAHVLKKDRAWLIAHGDAALPVRAVQKFRSDLERRKKHEPIAYLLGEKEFYGLTFRVNRHVLIPRPETELLVTSPLSLRRRGGLGGEVFWDVGTGSGCVAIAIAKQLPAAIILATDVSGTTLALARRNARHHQVTNVSFLKANLYDASVRRWFASHGNNKRLIIVANLPYLPNADKKKLAPDIVKYEPHAALFAGKTGRECIEKFLRQLAAFAVPFTSVFLEFDPPQATKLLALAKNLFPHADIAIHKDHSHRDRILEIRISKPNAIILPQSAPPSV